MWAKYKLSELGAIVGGATPSTSVEKYYGGEIAWVTPKDLSSFSGRYIECGERNITEEGLNSCSAQLLPAGSVLFSSRAPIGYVAIAKNPIATNQGFKSLVPDTEKVDSLFMYYLLKYNKNRIEAMGSGTTFKEVSGATMKNIEVNLPPLAEQKRIAGILGALDDKIELNRRINANLEEQAQALFKSWFVDFEPFRDGPFVDSELGKIPQGWKEGNYTDIVEIRGGGTPKTDMQEYWNGNIPFFSPKDVGAGCFILDTEKHITAKGLENCNSSLFQPNTVFITARGTVGKVVMSGTEMAMNQTNYALLGKQNIPQYYVYHITLQLVGRLLKKANGAVFNAITTRDFACEQIVIPPYSTIKHFSDIVKPIYENILLNEVQSNRLSALRDTLLPKLMSSELSVKNDYEL